MVKLAGDKRNLYYVNNKLEIVINLKGTKISDQDKEIIRNRGMSSKSGFTVV